MKPHQRHTEMTHHILGYPENIYGYEDEDCGPWCNCYWCDSRNHVNYDYDEDHKNVESYYVIDRQRWVDVKKLPNLYKLSKKYVNTLDVDLMSVYSLEIRRDIILESLLNEEKDWRNTIGSIVQLDRTALS